MKCPSAEQWDLLAMEVLDTDESQGLVSHARVCADCREQLKVARQEHTERVRMYEAFDRDHDQLREELMAALPDEAHFLAPTSWVARSRRRLGGIAMTLNQSTGRRIAALLLPAACVVIAAVFLTSRQSAFASALEQMRKADTIVARFQQFINQAEQPLLDGTMYMSNELGMRFDMDLGTFALGAAGGWPSRAGGEGPGMSIFREVDGPLVVLQPSMNMAITLHGVENLAHNPRRATPDEFIRKFLELSGEADRQLGISEMDGHTVAGFEVSAERLGLNFVGGGAEAHKGMAARLWIDADTNLPVRMEIELHVALVGGQVLAVYDQFEWDVPLEDGLFDVQMADGTREVDVTIPPMTENTLLNGLRLYAELTNRYPMSLDPTAVSAQVAMASAASGRIKVDDSEPFASITGELVGDVMTMSVTCAFVQKLAGDGHEPEYFGQRVTPDDTAEVLLRWTLNDGQVRVVYGDLQVETVPAE